MKDDDDQDGKDDETMTMITIMIMIMMKGAHLPKCSIFLFDFFPQFVIASWTVPPFHLIFFWRDKAQTMFENAEFGKKIAIWCLLSRGGFANELERTNPHLIADIR